MTNPVKKKCLNCGYERQPEDESDFIPASECPKCRAIYAKVESYIAQKNMPIEEKERLRVEAERKRVLQEKEAQIEAEGKRVLQEMARLEKEEERIRFMANDIWRMVESGQEAYIYESIYIPVDSTINEESYASLFDITLLKRMGLQGWGIVSVVPRTVGIGLTNETYSIGPGLKSWGGGIGGNVVGVHVILRKTLRICNKDTLDEELILYIKAQNI
jgi:thiol-disulfide isomerase/thioredoxin